MWDYIYAYMCTLSQYTLHVVLFRYTSHHLILMYVFWISVTVLVLALVNNKTKPNWCNFIRKVCKKFSTKTMTRVGFNYREYNTYFFMRISHSMSHCNGLKNRYKKIIVRFLEIQFSMCSCIIHSGAFNIIRCQISQVSVWCFLIMHDSIRHYMYLFICLFILHNKRKKTEENKRWKYSWRYLKLNNFM